MHSDAWIFVSLTYVLSTYELELEVIIDINGGNLAKGLLSAFVSQRKALNRSIEILGAPFIHADKGADEHATFDHYAIAPGRKGYSL